MNDRLGSCPPNHWTTQDWKPNDPRIAQVYVTDLAYTVTQASLLPLIDLGAFYITGWDSAIKPQCPTTGSFSEQYAL